MTPKVQACACPAISHYPQRVSLHPRQMQKWHRNDSRFALFFQTSCTNFGKLEPRYYRQFSFSAEFSAEVEASYVTYSLWSRRPETERKRLKFRLGSHRRHFVYNQQVLHDFTRFLLRNAEVSLYIFLEEWRSSFSLLDITWRHFDLCRTACSHGCEDWN